MKALGQMLDLLAMPVVTAGVERPCPREEAVAGRERLMAHEGERKTRRHLNLGSW